MFCLSKNKTPVILFLSAALKDDKYVDLYGHVKTNTLHTELK